MRNRPLEALRKLQGIEPKHHYHPDAKLIRAKATNDIISTALNDAIASCSERQWRPCHKAAIKILEQAPSHKNGLELLHEAEMQMKRTRMVFTPWSASN